MPLHLDLMPEEEKILEAPPPKTIVGARRLSQGNRRVSAPISTGKVGCGTKLVIRTDRGIELAEMLTTTCGNGGCNKSITRDKLHGLHREIGREGLSVFGGGAGCCGRRPPRIWSNSPKLDEYRRKHVDLCGTGARHNLPMKIVDVEHLLGGERVLFYFTSEQRVDFRSLVRGFAHDLHTRIELRQVGRAMRPAWLRIMKSAASTAAASSSSKVLTPISMRSAKVQKATLDPDENLRDAAGDSCAACDTKMRPTKSCKKVARGGTRARPNGKGGCLGH